MPHKQESKTSHHHLHATSKTIRALSIAFVVNLILSGAEIIGGLIAGSVALIADALHNTSDAFSILIAVIAFKIGQKKATTKYTYGFKRAEIIGGFVNLILLFVSGLYLILEGGIKLINPEPIEGGIIIWVSVLALVIDTITARLSHHGAEHNANIRMVFLHNMADALGSVGVIISGFCALYFNLYWVDGLIALSIAAYMIFQSIRSFPGFVAILMNAAPESPDTAEIIQALQTLPGVKNAHHLHMWCLSEHEIALECHLETNHPKAAQAAETLLKNRFGIRHCTIQTENRPHCPSCDL